MDMGTPLMEELEHLIDQHSLEAVIEATYRICYLKADHLASNWQDDAYAKLWEKAGERIGKLAMHQAITAVTPKV